MREIKFRAWDPVYKKWLKEDEYIISSDGGVIDVFVHTNGIDVEILDVNEHAILEQNTGLKDKNDFEIYENDIVRVQSHLYKDHIGAIIWLQGTSSFCISDNTNKFNIPRPLAIQMDGFLSYEVIGNIHENADLLEEQ